jgi:hypothetical protein
MTPVKTLLDFLPSAGFEGSPHLFQEIRGFVGAGKTAFLYRLSRLAGRFTDSPELSPTIANPDPVDPGFVRADDAQHFSKIFRRHVITIPRAPSRAVQKMRAGDSP